MPLHEDVWDLDPHTLAARLCIGFRLADLEPTLDSRFLFRKTRAGFRRIADNPKYTHLLRTAENKLGIMLMVTIRRTQPPRPGRGRWRKPMENPIIP